MRSLKSFMTLLALLAFSLQVLAAPMGVGCSHPVPDQSMQAMPDDAHAHHAMHTKDDSEQPQLNCDMGCNCGGDCVHACQLSVVQPNFSVTSLQPESLVLSTITDAPHQAYTLPLLRPPAIL